MPLLRITNKLTENKMDQVRKYVLHEIYHESYHLKTLTGFN